MNEKPHIRKRPLRIGGVMRCCVATLNQTMVTELEGETLECKHCSNRLVVRNGMWEWDSGWVKNAKTDLSGN